VGSRPDRRHQQPDHCLTVEGLGKKPDGTARLGTRAQMFFRKGRDEDRRYRTAGRPQPALQVKTAHARHLDIGDNAGGLRQIARVRESATSPTLDGMCGVYCEDCNIAQAVPADSTGLTGVRPWAIDRALAQRLWA
jgi:hypothetical protein